MTATFRSGSKRGQGAGGPTFALADPGASVGDLLVVGGWSQEVLANDGAWIKAPTSTFTDLLTTGATAFGSSLNVKMNAAPLYEFWWMGWRQIDGSESWPMTFTVLNGTPGVASLLPGLFTAAVYQNVVGSPLFFDFAYAFDDVGGGAVTIPPVTPGEDNVLILDFVLMRGSATGDPHPHEYLPTVDAVDDFYSLVGAGPLVVPAPGVLINDTTAPAQQNDISRIVGGGPDSDGGGLSGFRMAFGDMIWNDGTATPGRQWDTASGGAMWAWAQFVLHDGGTYVAPTNTLTSIKLTNPAHGVVTSFGTDGSFTYTPTGPFVGDDTFTYEAVGSIAGTDTATVHIHVTRSSVFHGRLKIGV